MFSFRSQEVLTRMRRPDWRMLAVASLLAATPVGCGDSRGTFAPGKITLAEAEDPNLMELTDVELRFVDDRGVEWVAPKGTLTDGATVPRLALSVTDGRFDRRFLKAAVVHDAYCQEFNKDRCPQQYRKRSWSDVHRMFFEACLAGGTPSMRAKMMFSAVWLGGPRWDDPERDLQDVPEEVLRAGYAGCEQWIEEAEPSLQAIESWMDQREPTVLEISKLESASTVALESGDLESAEKTLQESEQVIARALEQAPHDLMLLSLKGRHHNNKAKNFREMNQERRVEVELEQAEKAYQEIISVAPQEAGALKGLGDVSIMRDDLDQAEEYVRKAIEVAPEYPAAKVELEHIQRLRRRPR